jgi:MFS family permease
MRPRIILSLGNFFLSISATLVNYTLISYLSHFVPEVYIGVGIAIGGGLAVISFLFLPRLVTTFGAQRLVIFFTILEMILLFATAELPQSIASAIFVILVISLQPLLLYELDLLLEATIENKNETSRVRTFFLTGGNLGSLAAPLLIGALLANTENYVPVFLAAAAILTPFIVLFAGRELPKGKTPDLYQAPDTFKHLLKDRDLAAVTFGHLVLYLFYVWAPLYVPLYLRVVLGIPWSTLGWMFSVMLIPYILIEYPAGWIADRILGDQEMMLAGFLIAGSALAAVSLITPTSSPFLILFILLMTRTGSAFIESMTEGHFFRCVSEKDVFSVSVFRGVWPLANVIAPIVAGFILFFGNYQIFFVLTGSFVALGGAATIFFIRDFDPKKGRVCPT